MEGTALWALPTPGKGVSWEKPQAIWRPLAGAMLWGGSMCRAQVAAFCSAHRCFWTTRCPQGWETTFGRGSADAATCHTSPGRGLWVARF